MRFRDLTVVDIATLAAAPQIAAFFGDFGARVIKVEPPRGDALRGLVDRQGVALQWKVVNRNKQCVTLDLNKPAGREVLEKILTRTDLLVCALNRQRLHRWELDTEGLGRRHPRLVVVNLTTYGTSGPWSERSGSGTLAEAISGLAAITGPADAPPTLSPVGLGDYMGVLQGIIAALMGLYARDARRGTGRGELFDVAMYEPFLGLLAARLAASVRDGVEPGRHGNRFPTMAPRNTYVTADGRWVALTAGTDALVRKMFQLFGRPELSDDPRFVDHQARLAHTDELDGVIAAWMAHVPATKSWTPSIKPASRSPPSMACCRSQPTRTSAPAVISWRSTTWMPANLPSRRRTRCASTTLAASSTWAAPSGRTTAPCMSTGSALTMINSPRSRKTA